MNLKLKLVFFTFDVELLQSVLPICKYSTVFIIITVIIVQLKCGLTSRPVCADIPTRKAAIKSISLLTTTTITTTTADVNTVQISEIFKKCACIMHTLLT